MNPTAGDTLDIQPMAPPSANFVAPSQTADDVAAARAKIELIGAAPAGQVIEEGQSVSLRLPAAEPASVAAQVIPPPVSPTAQIYDQLPTIPAAKPRAVPSPLKPILSAVGAFIFLLVIFKSQIIFSQLKYLTSKTTTPTTAVTAPAAAVIPAAPTISIPKINVDTPVVYQSSIQENDILTSLQNGVVHYGTTPVPGQGGNMVIVGHSSNDWWEAGNYKFVFVLLDKLVVGDQFSINYQSHRYVYQVTNVKVVLPTDLSVLAPTTTPTATLITCTPPGTSWKRLVVQAKQISPDPSQAAAPGQTYAQTGPVQLPGNAPSFTSQLKDGWNNIVHGVEGIFGHSTPAPTTPTTTTTPGDTGTPTTLPGAN